MRISRKLALGASLLTLSIVGTTGVGAQSSPSAPTTNPPVKIGSDGFYESKLVAEIYAQALEAGGYTVERSLGIGRRTLRAPAFEKGDVNLVPEYVGSGLGYYEPTKPTADGEANRAALQAVFDAKDHLATVFAISPGQDRNQAAVRPDTAATLHLAKMSDLAAVQDKLTWGFPSECATNALCSGALAGYGITYPPAKLLTLDACDVPMGASLQGGAIDVGWFCETQPAIAQYGFVRLEDDKGLQPGENIAPLVRNDYLAQLTDTAGFRAILDAVSANLTLETLTNMGVDYGINHVDIPVVAANFLKGGYATMPTISPPASPVGSVAP